MSTLKLLSFWPLVLAEEADIGALASWALSRCSFCQVVDGGGRVMASLAFRWEGGGRRTERLGKWAEPMPGRA